MDFRMVAEQEWRNLQSTAYMHAEIKERVSKLVKSLGILFNDRENGGVSELKFEPIDNGDIVCSIGTPCGAGRMRLNWTVLNGILHGSLFIDRSSIDAYDRIRWEPVWRLYIPERSGVFVDNEQDAFALRFGGGQQLENDVFAIGLSIFLAIVSGPMTKEG